MEDPLYRDLVLGLPEHSVTGGGAYDALFAATAAVHSACDYRVKGTVILANASQRDHWGRRLCHDEKADDNSLRGPLLKVAVGKARLGVLRCILDNSQRKLPVDAAKVRLIVCC